MITEFCPGGDLQSLLVEKKSKDGNFKEEEIVMYLMQTLKALKYSHSNFNNEVLHLDLKPDNIFLKNPNLIKLGDFGACMDIELEKKYFLEESGRREKTSKYMAPELFKNPPQASAKCDIWSLGCIIYELITLKGPFEDSSWMHLIKKIQED